MTNIDTGKAFDDAMEYAVALWQTMRPDEVTDFQGLLKYQRDCGKEQGFWSEGRQFKHVGECPAFVHARIAERLEDFQWYTRKPLRDRFFARFSQFRMDPLRFTGTTQSSRG